MKVRVVEVVRKSERVIMVINVVLEDNLLNIISAYAPQVGLEESQNKGFWQDMNDIPGSKDIVIGRRYDWTYEK